MKTAQLILWKHNTNKSNVLVDSLGGNELFLQENYIELFQELANILKEKSVSSFIPLWKDTIKAVLKKVEAKVRAAVPSASDDSIERIITKFQGNVGEIFAEKFFTSGLGADWCKPDSYVPVDPSADEGTDAVGISPISGLQIGIQVKNYIHSGKVDIEVFRTAGDESDKLVHTLALEKFTDFLRCPSQYIFTCGVAEKIFIEKYENRVKFLGPEYIETKGLCGKRGSKCGNWTFFQEIADELRSFR